jgi:hypothetical protein
MTNVTFFLRGHLRIVSNPCDASGREADLQESVFLFRLNVASETI